MSYQEFKPSPQLAHLVDCYWVSEEKTSGIHRVLPDGCADLIFNFAATITNTSNRQVSLPKESISAVGMMTTFRDVWAPLGSHLLGIRFKSGCLSALTSTPLSELKNTTVGAREIIPEFNPVFLEELYHINDVNGRIIRIEQILNSLLINAKADNDILISSVTDLILQSHGRQRAGEVADAACLSLRQLQRRFKAKVGLGLKEYIRVIRFMNTSAMIKSSPNKSILEIAFESGYYDHAHLNNDFKQMAGTVPSSLK